jgi:hypothetical protein
VTNGFVGFVIGLLLGVYLTASFPGHVVKEFESLGIPLLGHHKTVDTH